VTRGALAECTEAEIATITGHGLRDVRSILDTYHLHRDAALAESAIRKFEKRTESSKWSTLFYREIGKNVLRVNWVGYEFSNLYSGAACP
jgi:hypothetical protein